MKGLEFYTVDGTKLYGVVGETAPVRHQMRPAGLGYDARCGWCWQGIAHTNEAHQNCCDEWNRRDAADKAAREHDATCACAAAAAAGLTE